MTGTERRALNESVFREVNERLQVLGEEFGHDQAAFICECADVSCTQTLSVPMSVYEAVREHPSRFLVVPGHERTDTERVVEEHPDYRVVEKGGAAAEVVEQTDPRSED